MYERPRPLPVRHPGLQLALADGFGGTAHPALDDQRQGRDL
jgi:hypothetical protein